MRRHAHPLPLLRFPRPFEFVTIGESTGPRPTPQRPTRREKFFDYAYLRTNPAGPSEEYWYHAFGCRSWLKVVRDTRTHAIGKRRSRQGGARDEWSPPSAKWRSRRSTPRDRF
ncbi:MAG: sarcosine oxidase subunit delta [Methylovirgula sp.]